MNDTHYVIAGGQEGKSRLNVLADAMYPYTKSLLLNLGLKEGISFLDNGCGGGNVSLMVAKMIGNGKLTAIDFDETIIALNKQDAIDNAINNISFEANSAYDIAYENEFDISYARFLLSHLERPLDALKKMVAATKTGGKVVVEDIQFSGHFSYPSNKAYDEYLKLYSGVVKRKGGNAEIGPKLFKLFHEAGIADIGFDIVQPTFTKGQGKWMAYLTLEKIKDSLVNEGIIEAAIVDDLLQELKIFTEDETTMMSLPRVFRVWGSKGE
jgi:ubiquinone/menaquinone biosynthesis C-methylase UbiE